MLSSLPKFGQMGPNAILHESNIHGTWLLYQVWIKSTHSTLRYHRKQKIYEQVAMIAQIWHRDKYYFTKISKAWYPINVPNIDQIYQVLVQFMIYIYARNHLCF